VYHQQDGYPDDPAERSMIDEVEPINQAKRYARYVVNSEWGYDTVEWRQDPDRMLAVALTIAEMDTDAVGNYFGGLYDQVRSHATDVDRPVELPDDLIPGHLNYQQDIYLGLDDQARTSIARLSATLDENDLADGPAESIEDVAAGLLEMVPAEDGLDISDLTVEAVSGIHLRWDDATGTYHHERNGEPAIDRDPDARLDMMPFTPETIREFQSRLVHNLLCQVRDCYIEMGVTPPKPFRIQGLGKHRTSTWYEHYEFYQRYHDPAADIDWQIEPLEHREN
jgi:hypothetical protein